MAAAALLTVAQSQLGDLDLRASVKYLLIALIAILVAAITAKAGANSARAATLEQEHTLEAALAGRIQRVRDRDPFDLGVRPEPPMAPYRARAIDQQLDEALTSDPQNDAPMILVVGPPKAGKTRSAFEALARKQPQAILLAPVDGPAVSTLLAQRNKFSSNSDGHAVLWLDSLERYFEKLDLDALDELLFPAEPKTKSSEQARSAVGRLSKALRQRKVHPSKWMSTKEPLALERKASRRLIVVASIREQTLQDALERDDAVGQTARRLTARMKTIVMAASTDPTPPTGAVPTTTHAASFEPEAFKKSPAPTDGRGLLTVLGCLLLLLGIGLFFAVQKGWKVPPSLPNQVSELKNSLQACQTPYESPQAGKLHKGSSWVLVVSNKDCPGSDVLRYYTVENEGRLEEQFNESPDSRDRWEFTCLAPQPSPCLVHVPGVGPVALGAFRDSTDGQMLALALYKSGDSTRLYAPFLPPPSTAAASAERHTPVLTLQLHPGAAYSPEPNAPTPLCRHPAQLCSRPAQFLSVMPQGNTHPLLISGTVIEGTAINPQRIALHPFALQYMDKRLQVDPRECLFYSNGAQVSAKRYLTVKPTGEDVPTQMRNWWSAQAPKHENIVC